ncbi:unnamed protein product [Medioppia subpectinata]|uniref:C3H1-type domain-containing protein n=1 Tax=Medioppia subpectinata TaxID=1979941 RepID=A0A7R9L1P9_9ACAR|nr:unnamed protein product [Medioppia subpectinata]CAG2113875.1 unnamed protein product [Medioppia subpectinata]
MGRQYQCDYCLRRFKDLPQNRKKHLKSNEHKNAVKAYHSALKTSRDLLADELNKSVCNHYYRHGFCKFGDNCIHSHLTWDRLQELRHRAIAEDMAAAVAAVSGRQSQTNVWPIGGEQGFDATTHLDVWLRKRFNTTTSGAEDNVGDSGGHRLSAINTCDTFADLKAVFNALDARQIPISLIPPTIEDFNESEECEWK